MESHVKILAVLNIVLGVIGALVALVILVFLGGAAALVGTAGRNEPGAAVAAPILVIIGTVLFVLLLILSAPSIIAGMGLLKYREWARILTIILSVLNLPMFPFGTALGVYGLWVLVNAETARLFAGQAAPRT